MSTEGGGEEQAAAEVAAPVAATETEVPAAAEEAPVAADAADAASAAEGEAAAPVEGDAAPDTQGLKREREDEGPDDADAKRLASTVQ